MLPLLKRLHGGLLTLLLTSRGTLAEFKRLGGRLRWWKILLIVCAIIQFAMLATGAWWGLQAHRFLSTIGVDRKDLQGLLSSQDPVQDGAFFIRQHPQLIGLARGAIHAAVNENSRVIVLPEGNRVIFDVSAKRTFRFLFDHILANHQAEMLPRERKSDKDSNGRMYVVDFGAFDGLIASNSYNFLELGWRGLLVEPTPGTFKLLRNTVRKFGEQVALENVAVGNESKLISFYTYDNPTSNSMFNRDPKYAKSRSKVTAQMWKASALLQKHNVPKEFGVLSIDVEGFDQEVLHDVLNAGFRPKYIIIEVVTLGLKELGARKIEDEMQQRGYSLIAKLHLNFIFHEQAV